MKLTASPYIGHTSYVSIVCMGTCLFTMSACFNFEAFSELGKNLGCGFSGGSNEVNSSLGIHTGTIQGKREQQDATANCGYSDCSKLSVARGSQFKILVKVKDAQPNEIELRSTTARTLVVSDMRRIWNECLLQGEAAVTLTFPTVGEASLDLVVEDEVVDTYQWSVVEATDIALTVEDVTVQGLEPYEVVLDLSDPNRSSVILSPYLVDRYGSTIISKGLIQSNSTDLEGNNVVAPFGSQYIGLNTGRAEVRFEYDSKVLSVIIKVEGSREQRQEL